MTENVSLYVSNPDEFYRWVKRLELSYNELYEAEKQEIHEAIYQVAREHEHEVVEKVAGEPVDEKPDGHLFDYPDDGEKE